MSSIGSPPKRAEARAEPSSSNTHAEALAQRQIDDAGHQAPIDNSASRFDSPQDLHITGTVGPENASAEAGLEPPAAAGEHRMERSEMRSPPGAQAGSTLATHLEHAMHVFSHDAHGVPQMPQDEAADVLAFGLHASLPNGARQKSLQLGQQGFVVPMTLRRAKRTAYSEKSVQETERFWDHEAIEALIGTLHVSIGGGTQTHDEPAMRKERRFQRWLSMLAHRRRVQRSRGHKRR